MCDLTRLRNGALKCLVDISTTLRRICWGVLGLLMEIRLVMCVEYKLWMFSEFWIIHWEYSLNHLFICQLWINACLFPQSKVFKLNLLKNRLKQVFYLEEVWRLHSNISFAKAKTIKIYFDNVEKLKLLISVVGKLWATLTHWTSYDVWLTAVTTVKIH